MKDQFDSQALRLLNDHLKHSDDRNRSGSVKLEQVTKLHEAMNHRPHQQEY